MEKTGLAVLTIVGIVLVIIVLVVVGMVFYVIAGYNSLVKMDETVKTAWSQVENQLQRRNDLIPNLVNSVKGYAAHEKGIFENVAEARSKLAGAQTRGDKIKAANEVSGFLGRLLAIVENYPQLKADINFRQIMDELAGTENRIAVERMRYNETVKVFNQSIRVFPKNMIANAFGFKLAQLFEAAEGTKAVPKVDFVK
ncbi:LemA family protein [bacterium]|nr:LemA family protein [bacterium]